MNLKRISFLLSFSTLLVIGCSFKNNQKRIVEERNSLILPQKVYSFFPDEALLKKGLKLVFQSTNAFYSDLPYDTIFFATKGLIEIYQINDKQIMDSLKESYTNQSIVLFSSESKDYFIISSERDLFKQYDTLTLKNKYLDIPKDRMSMDFHPYFEEGYPFYKKENTNGLEDGYHIAVLEMDTTYILPAKYKNEWELHPSYLKHGYRSGVAFKSEGDYMIYWVVAW